LNQLILGIVAKAQAMYDVAIHAFVVLSNHTHFLLSPRDARELAGFMAFVNGNLAREAGRLHGWRERFWGRRYRAIVIADVDDAAQIARLRYIFSNGVKEGLVARAADWPGVSCVRALVDGAALEGVWVDRTRLFHARRAQRRISEKDFVTREAVTLSPLPCWAGLQEDERRRLCADLVREVEAEARQELQRAGRTRLGRGRVLAQNPHDLPTDSHRSAAPFVHASTREVRQEFVARYRAFVDAYRIACERLRRGAQAWLAGFPPGAFPPLGQFRVSPALPA
jgi:REP element-mobilizing transposase RayT